MADEEQQVMDLEGAVLDDEDFEAMQKTEFTEEEAIAFKGVYNHYDNQFGKGDGKCTPQLVKSMVRALGITMYKADEEKLAQMIVDCDEDQDGNTQFPEFLVLIDMMQKCNFCGMNDAAAMRVREEEQAAKAKMEQEERKVREKAAHRASSAFLNDQTAMLEILAKETEDKAVSKSDSEFDSDDDSDEDEEKLKPYDEKTDGLYSNFYYKNHKSILDELKAEFSQRRASLAVK